MPDIGIETIGTCLKALEELPHEDAIAAVQYITQRLNIKENRRRVIEAQKQKLGREPTDEEAKNALDEWEDVVAGDPSTSPATAAYPHAPLGASLPTPAAYMKRAI